MKKLTREILFKSMYEAALIWCRISIIVLLCTFFWWFIPDGFEISLSILIGIFISDMVMVGLYYSIGHIILEANDYENHGTRQGNIDRAME